MSGLACEIILHGNYLQALMRSLLALLPDNGSAFPPAQVAIGHAQSLCELGTAVYDGNDVMLDAQKEAAAAMMKTLNDAVAPLVLPGKELGPFDREKAFKAVLEFIEVAVALLLELVPAGVTP